MAAALSTATAAVSYDTDVILSTAPPLRAHSSTLRHQPPQQASEARAGASSTNAATAAAAAAAAVGPVSAVAGDVDPLLATLLLAEERLAIHRPVQTATTHIDVSDYHAGAVTTLSHTLLAPPPPLRRDVVDASAVAAQASAAATPAPLTSMELHAVDGAGADAEAAAGRRRSRRRRTAPRPQSRREQAHAARMAVALHPATPAAPLPREPPTTASAAPPPPVRGDDNSRGGGGDGGGGAAADGGAAVAPPHSRQRRRRRSEHRAAADAETTPAPAATVNDSRDDEGDGGDAATAAEAAAPPYDYDPDGDDAEQLIAERTRLLQASDTAADLIHTTTGGGPVRAAAFFQCGPAPAWVHLFSDVLLCDCHRLDAQVAAMLKSSSSSGGDVVQLPVDAVVLRLRSDIARVRRARDALQRSSSSSSSSGLVFSLLSLLRASHAEVYGPAKAPHAHDDDGARDGEVVVGDNGGAMEEAAAATAATAAAAAAAAAAAGASPPPPPSASPLSRALEAKDVQRPLLAQVVPLWRRRGAAVQSLTELLELLEGRLRAFGQQIDDPTQGVLLDLVGAPASTGVDGVVPSTYPPALERALRTVITNTLLSDVFATARSALPHRGLRLSEALRRGQTPRIHAEYVTAAGTRPVYDRTVLLNAAQRRGHVGSDGGSSSGVDMRKSYAVHIDYIRLQPSLEHVGGPGAVASGDTGAAVVALASPHARRRLSSATSLSQDPLSSLLLGSQSNILIPADMGGGDGSRCSPTDAAATAAAADAALREQQRQSHHGRLHSTASALLLALSAATAQHSLVAFTPEDYLTSLLLQYYEQYRLLQLNLLPTIKSRAFYSEQVRQLQRQSQRQRETEQLQQRLEALEEASAAVERSCLRVMIVLWNSVVILRRQQQQQQQSSAAAAAASHSAATGVDDVPIIVDGRGGRARHSSPPPQQQQQQTRNHGRSLASVAAAARDERAHPAVYAGDAAVEEEEDVTSVPAAAVVHRVDGSILYDAAVDLPPLLPVPEQQQHQQHLHGGGGERAPLASPQPSSLLSPPSLELPHEQQQQQQQQQQRCNQFRFFLRRYGTAEETPYVVGDDLLRYAAAVEGADALAPPTTATTTAAAAAATHDDSLLYVQVVVFARAQRAMAPQYIGCTTPQPMTAAKVIFINETFEVRALREPAELLLHVIPVTAGPAKHTVVATVRLQPTLTRTYGLVPLEPPTAFVFRGRLFTTHYHHHHHQHQQRGGAAATATTSLHGVLAVSTTWTSSHGLTAAQMEDLFLARSGAAAADPLDPQYRPLLRLLRSHYVEQDEARAAAAGAAVSAGGGGGGAVDASRGDGRGGRRSARRSERGHRASVVAVDDTASLQQHHHQRRAASASAAAGTSQRHLRTRRTSSIGSVDRLSRGTSSHALQALRRSSISASAAVGGGSGGGGVLQPLRTASSAQLLAPLLPSLALQRQSSEAAELDGAHHRTSQPAAGSHDVYVAEDVEHRLPSARLRHLHRRWLIQLHRCTAADEVESRLLSHPMPLDDADAYRLHKSVRRSVELEEAERVRDYGAAAGAIFDAQHYYTTPSAISGLALSPLPRETKLKLWQERQRRLLLTLRARRRLTDAERLETIVRVPKLVMKLVFNFAPRSQLNPHRKERPKTEDIDRAVLARRRDSRIVLHIMKAQHLPRRADGTPLEAFAQASFVSEVAFTRTEVGSDPAWFQSLELSFQPLDFEEDTLSMIDDDVIISIYDKVEVRMGASNGSANNNSTTAAVAHETHYRTERRFIGTLRIPFASLHQASEARLEGVFPLRMPRWLLGYDTQGGDNNNNINNSGGGGGGAPAVNPLGVAVGEAAAAAAAAATPSPEMDVDEYTEPSVQLYMSLWPPLQREPPPGLSRSELEQRVSELNVSPQLRYLHQLALRWQKASLRRMKAIGAMNAQASTRQVEPFVTCTTGDLVFVCRYLLPRGGAPPPSVRTVYEAIRYVSLLPFVADTLAWGERDVWCTNAELLAMRSGDYEELALLLLHFLRHLAPDRATYAVVGSGTLYTQTIMVLHAFEDGEWMLIDPRSGWTVSAGKPYGTILHDVYMVVSHDQLWANVQLSGLPHRMTWDLTNTAHWLPCFDGVKDARVAACTPHLFPIQRTTLSFLPPDAVRCREIELELRACVKKSLLVWRNGSPPAYHRGVEAILRELLDAAEVERCTYGSARRRSLSECAAARLSEYFGEDVAGAAVGDASGVGRLRVHGSPVMGSYNPSDPEFKELLQQVFERAVHEVGTSEASFAVGTYVKSYTGDVYAMWVFLVVICRG
ncbi:Meckel syndrome type 6 protein [Novymonas esmeraldas]|uniref:Meckel syndrome type 6 protein n=1 Tax=Novymonas esmeraldas TaxID=1808958 RepID=A0AAW0EL30_9TRYP